jgi:hypothetical protein|tara:strand:- start:15965 stop:16366 length:402 start_codon:yes stop_codon:yes gene_type:complete
MVWVDYHNIMFKIAIFLILFTTPLHALGMYNCVELERVSLAAEGSMRPMYQGRKLNFTWNKKGFLGGGVFYHNDYDITMIGDDGFSAYAKNPDRNDLFRFQENILMHTAIVNYRADPSVQSQVFRCKVELVIK